MAAPAFIVRIDTSLARAVCGFCLLLAGTLPLHADGLAQHRQQAAAPPLLLAKVYQSQDNIRDYWVSEKLDGVRAYWNGRRLISRRGHVFNAPAWFVAGFPQRALDGELWMGRGQFAATLSTVSKQQPVDAQWQQLKYMLFELPDGEGDFTARIATLKHLVEQAASPYLQLVPQRRIHSQSALEALLETTVASGGEGLMLHHADSLYSTGRSDALLKLKTYQDAEAVVVQHLPGKGKHRGRLGALLVELPSGQRFKIGTGFSHAEREQPPPIGSVISFKYYGLSRNGIPKFASFLRVRQSD